MLRGRPAFVRSSGNIEDVETPEDAAHRRSLHYTLIVGPYGHADGLVGLTVLLNGWHPRRGSTSDLQYRVFVAEDELARRLTDLASEVLRNSRELHRQRTCS